MRLSDVLYSESVDVVKITNYRIVRLIDMRLFRLIDVVKISNYGIVEFSDVICFNTIEYLTVFMSQDYTLKFSNS